MFLLKMRPEAKVSIFPNVGTGSVEAIETMSTCAEAHPY